MAKRLPLELVRRWPSTKYNDLMVRGIGEDSAHAYDVNVKDENGKVSVLFVHAANRTQAVFRAEQFGYAVQSVNMVG